MANKTAAKSGLKKAKTPSEHALTLAALKRATAVVTAEAKKANDGEVPELDAGGYPVEVVIDINGDVNVAARSVTKPKGKPTFTDEELAACCYAQNCDAIKDAMCLLRECTPEALKAKVAAYREARDAVAKKARRWDKGEESTSAGAVTGNPAVSVQGRVGKHTLKLSVAST